MKIERPHFELSRVYSDGIQETPEIIPVGTMPWDTKMERRGFLGVGVGVASLLLLLDGEATAQVTSPNTNQPNSAPAEVPEKGLKAHTHDVNALCFAPDGKILASASDDRTVKLWSMPDAKLLATLEGHQTFVKELAFSPDGKRLASASDDNGIKLWSLPDCKLLDTLEEHVDVGGGKRAFSSDGKTVAVAYRGITLSSLPDRKQFATLEGHDDNVYALVISADGKFLASGSADRSTRLWSLPDGKLIATLQEYGGTVLSVAITQDSKVLASASSDHTIKLWTMPHGKLLATLEEHNSPVYALAITPDGKTLASGAGEIKLWSLPGGKLLCTLDDQRIKSGIRTLAISPDGKTLAAGHTNGMVILWDLERRSFLSFLFDPKANETDAISYNIFDRITGRTVTFTLPCGSPIPPGAVCTCNCVPGTYRPPSSGGGYPSGGGTYCACNKVCTCIPVPSDRDVKEAFERADPVTILQRLAELPIQTWNYNWDDATVRHIGPMAQDFAAAFAVGEDDKHIHPVDAQGVAFAAIQALYSLLKDKEANTEKLKAQLQQHREENEALKARVEALEPLVRMLS